jgi:hypothetical protein
VDYPSLIPVLFARADRTILDHFRPPSSSDRVGECGKFRWRMCGDIQQGQATFQNGVRVSSGKSERRQEEGRRFCGENHSGMGDVGERHVGLRRSAEIPGGLLAEMGTIRGWRLPGSMGGCWMQGLLCATAVSGLPFQLAPFNFRIARKQEVVPKSGLRNLSFSAILPANGEKC